MNKVFEAKISAIEIQDGLEYNGQVELKGITFYYHLRFIDRFDRLDERNIQPDELLTSTRIDVKINGRLIELTEQEKGFFIGYTGLVARELFGSAQRDDLRYMGIGSNAIDFPLSQAIGKSYKSQLSIEKSLSVNSENPTIAGLISKYNFKNQ